MIRKLCVIEMVMFPFSVTSLYGCSIKDPVLLARIVLPRNDAEHDTRATAALLALLLNNNIPVRFKVSL